MYEKFHFQEMACSSSVIIQRLLRYQDSSLEHLLKLFYFRDLSDYIHSWMSAVYKCNIQTHRNVKNNKWPTFDFLFKYLWKNEEDAFIDSHHEGYIASFASYKYLPKIEKPDLEGASLFCEAYYSWLAKEFSQKGSVKLEEVEEKLSFLLKEIPCKPTSCRYPLHYNHKGPQVPGAEGARRVADQTDLSHGTTDCTDCADCAINGDTDFSFHAAIWRYLRSPVLYALPSPVFAVNRD
jgi:hypothetical protein